MPKKFKMDLAGQTIKAVIHETENQIILVRNIKKENGPMTKNTLIKAEIIKRPKGKIMIYRGLNLNDMAIIKKNWTPILKAMIS